jgi:hypothetical protein
LGSLGHLSCPLFVAWKGFGSDFKKQKSRFEGAKFAFVPVNEPTI